MFVARLEIIFFIVVYFRMSSCCIFSFHCLEESFLALQVPKWTCCHLAGLMCVVAEVDHFIDRVFDIMSLVRLYCVGNLLYDLTFVDSLYMVSPPILERATCREGRSRVDGAEVLYD